MLRFHSEMSYKDLGQTKLLIFSIALFYGFYGFFHYTALFLVTGGESSFRYSPPRASKQKA